MRYLDTGSRDERNTLARWFDRHVGLDVAELRWQSGFFFADGAGPFVGALERLRTEGCLVHAIIGANPRTTLRDDVKWLAEKLGIPRARARLVLVAFSGGLYHPKVYHVRRSDGSQAAYVGSANLTMRAVSGFNIEAGVSLDSREGDDAGVLDQVAIAVDYWVESAREGATMIDGEQAIDAAFAAGLLIEALPSRRELPAEVADEAGDHGDQGDNAGGAERSRRPPLRPLVNVPRVRQVASAAGTSPVTVRYPLPTAAPRLVSSTAAAYAASSMVPRAGYPSSFFFAPAATEATSGADAISGSTLPGSAVGVVVRLNRDSARHFSGGKGTANMSIPLATAHTLRFGLYEGKYTRPRAEFELRVRYRDDEREIVGDAVDTNVMAYGYEPDEPGHKDLRLVIPASVRDLGAAIQRAGFPAPTIDDAALVEWPTSTDPAFRLTFLRPGSALSQTAESLLAAAERSGDVVGRGAAWLPAGVSPSWP